MKYSPNGGSITLRLVELPDEVQYVVSDQGLGMDENQMRGIFTPFYRVRRSETRKVRGTGLGLYLSKHLAEAHGGRLWAESVPVRAPTSTSRCPSAQIGNGERPT